MKRKKRKEKILNVSPVQVLTIASSYTGIINLLENCRISPLTLIKISAPNDSL